MTHIVYDRDELSISMEGHAGAALFGKDLVCAALSMLMLCLERRLSDCGEQLMSSVRKGPGRASISACPGSQSEKSCRESFDTVAAGFALLAERIPEHVKFTQIGERGEEDEY